MELFEIHLDPGASHPVVMTSMPIEPQPMWWGNVNDPAQVADILPVALSSSGTELAVAETAGQRGVAVKVFSVTTGELLHQWTTTDVRLPDGLPDAPALTWIDGDRALALATLDTLGMPTAEPINMARQTVRRLDVDAQAGSDLVADGTVQWKVPANGTASTCGFDLNWPPVISADGKSFSCVTNGGSFVTYPLTAAATGAGPGRADLSIEKGDVVNTVLWTSASGDTIIAEWAVSGGLPFQSNGKGTEIGVISHGTSAPLRFPPGFEQVYAGGIAW
jgi:hypothetical protein